MLCLQVHWFLLPSQICWWFNSLRIFPFDYSLFKQQSFHFLLFNRFWFFVFYLLFVYSLSYFLLFLKYDCLKFFEHIYNSTLTYLSAKSNIWSYLEFSVTAWGHHYESFYYFFVCLLLLLLRTIIIIRRLNIRSISI